MSCTDLRVSHRSIDLRVNVPAVPKECEYTVAIGARVYAATLDLRVVPCVDEDSTRYAGLPLGGPVLGNFLLG